MKNLFVNYRARISRWKAIKCLFKNWTQLQKMMPMRTNQRNSELRLLVVPCDPWSVFGSRGDEAMIEAALDHFRENTPEIKIAVITADAFASQAVIARGLIPLEVWQGRDYLNKIAQTIVEFDPDYGVVLGADVMDGYYAPQISLTLLASADLMTRHGVKTSLLGFSFNKNPNLAMARGFKMTSPTLDFHLRDPFSLERFERFTGLPGMQVADTAFLMHADSDFSEYEDVRNWCVKCQERGEIVLAVNLHPMLIAEATPEIITEQYQATAKALEMLLSKHPINLLLLPHDYRENVGDRHSLDPLNAELIKHFDNRIRYVVNEYHANQLKALAGLADGVLSARMHLAIGALSMGVPVCTFVYQDKFHGLFQLFGLPKSLLFLPPVKGGEEDLCRSIDAFVENLTSLRDEVNTKLPAIKQLAAKNLEWA